MSLPSVKEYVALKPLTYLAAWKLWNSKFNRGPLDIIGLGKLLPQNVSIFSIFPSKCTNATTESWFSQLKQPELFAKYGLISCWLLFWIFSGMIQIEILEDNLNSLLASSSEFVSAVDFRWIWGGVGWARYGTVFAHIGVVKDITAGTWKENIV